MENAAVAVLARTLDGDEEEVAAKCAAFDQSALCMLFALSVIAHIKGAMWAYSMAAMPTLGGEGEAEADADALIPDESEKTILKKASFRSIARASTALGKLKTLDEGGKP